MSSVAMYNPMSSMDDGECRVNLVSLDQPCTIPCHPWMTENVDITIHGYQYILVYPLVRVSVDARFTLVSLDHPQLPVYTGLPPCQSIHGCHSYSGIPEPSMVTSIYWSTPVADPGFLKGGGARSAPQNLAPPTFYILMARAHAHHMNRTEHEHLS